MPSFLRAFRWALTATLCLGPVLVQAASDDEEDLPKQPEKKTQEPAKPAPKETPQAQKPVEKPKPAFEKGKATPLFPADRSSKTVDHQSPAMQQGQKSGIPETKYEGWSYMGRKLDGWTVKGGELNVDCQCALTLDGFPFKDFKAELEVDLGASSGLGIMLGTAKEGVQMLAVTSTHVLPGVWDQTKQDKSVTFENKSAKPLGVKGGWIPLTITVAQGWVDVAVNQKSVYKERMLNPSQFPQFGFLTLGLNGNKDPKAKVRKASLTGM